MEGFTATACLKRALRTIVLLLVTTPLAFAELESVRAEVDTLLGRLGQSCCSFYRNGEWYPAEQAKAHLLRKLKAAGEPPSTEQFIDELASESSLSGKAYLVRCGESAPVESNTWLMEQLELMRTPP